MIATIRIDHVVAQANRLVAKRGRRPGGRDLLEVDGKDRGDDRRLERRLERGRGIAHARRSRRPRPASRETSSGRKRPDEVEAPHRVLLRQPLRRAASRLRQGTDEAMTTTVDGSLSSRPALNDACHVTPSIGTPTCVARQRLADTTRRSSSATASRPRAARTPRSSQGAVGTHRHRQLGAAPPRFTSNRGDGCGAAGGDGPSFERRTASS